MTVRAWSPLRRLAWHPVPLAGALLGAAVLVAAGSVLGGPAAGWTGPLSWLVAGAAAGFATSGST